MARATKRCSKCATVKPLSDFQRRTRSRDGHNTLCKACKTEYEIEYYRKNPKRRAQIRRYERQRNDQVKLWVLDYLDKHPCADCGERDVVVLDFDHTDRATKSENVSHLIQGGNLQKVKQEIAKCVVRCANCHRRKTARESGSYRLWRKPDGGV